MEVQHAMNQPDGARAFYGMSQIRIGHGECHCSVKPNGLRLHLSQRRQVNRSFGRIGLRLDQLKKPLDGKFGE